MDDEGRRARPIKRTRNWGIPDSLSDISLTRCVNVQQNRRHARADALTLRQKVNGFGRVIFCFLARADERPVPTQRPWSLVLTQRGHSCRRVSPTGSAFCGATCLRVLLFAAPSAYGHYSLRRFSPTGTTLCGASRPRALLASRRNGRQRRQRSRRAIRPRRAQRHPRCRCRQPWRQILHAQRAGTNTVAG